MMRSVGYRYRNVAYLVDKEIKILHNQNVNQKQKQPVLSKIAVEMFISTPLNKIASYRSYTLFCNLLIHTAHTVLNLDYHSHVSLVKMHINSICTAKYAYIKCFK